MKRLTHRFDQLRQEKRDTALAGCRVAELFLSTREPQLFDAAQRGVRTDLQNVEARIREWRARSDSQARPRYIERFRNRYGPSALIGEHLEFARLIGVELDHLRQIFRQIGDGLAWAILRQEPRIIAPLYAKRTNRLATGRGGMAPQQLIFEAHRTGKFLVIDNDITRCLGDGDITVVRADRPWLLPATYEVKSPGGDDGDVPEGKELVINCSAALTGHPDQTALHKEFFDALNFTDGAAGPRQEERIAKQRIGMQRRAQVLVAATRPLPALKRKQSYWSTLESVIAKAQQYGTSFDEPEPGLVYAAIRLQRGENTEAMLESMLARMGEHVPHGEPMLSTATFQTTDEFSAVIPPIVLWRLPQAQRTALLAGDVMLGCVFRGDIFERAVAVEGLDLRLGEGGSWTIVTEHAKIDFDRIEVAKLRLGLAFNAMSAREFAAACASQIRSVEAE